jgi:hypothetical protein
MIMKGRNGDFKQWALLGVLLVAGIGVFAQNADGNQGINQANTMVRGYFDSAVNLMYGIGAIVGIIGAIRVYSLWVQGEHVQKIATAWFSACIFLVVVATVIKSFFGL